MATKSLNKNLRNASKAKKDEFYTQLVDIEKELKHYKERFKGKIVYCNCDDPYESNFFKYFASNFNALGLKKLITTSYSGSPIVGGQLPLFQVAGSKSKQPFKIEIKEVPDSDKDGAKSPKYCSMCYANGEFLNPPEIDTAEKFQKYCIQEMKKDGMNGILAWVLTRGIPKLERWQKK